MSVKPKEQPDSPRPPQRSKEERAATLQLVRAAAAFDELYDLIGSYAQVQRSESRRKSADSDVQPADNL